MLCEFEASLVVYIVSSKTIELHSEREKKKSSVKRNDWKKKYNQCRLTEKYYSINNCAMYLQFIRPTD